MWNLYRVYVGANNDTGVVELSLLKTILDKRFTGYTIIKTQGRWEGKDEPSVIVEIQTDCGEKGILALIGEICRELGQKCCGYQTLPGILFTSGTAKSTK